MVAMMSPWEGLAIGAVGLLAFSALVGLFVAAILGRVGEDSELLDAEAWASKPLTRGRSTDGESRRQPLSLPVRGVGRRASHG
jgi:hypothetical protein